MQLEQSAGKVRTICLVFEKTLQTGRLPADWKKAFRWRADDDIALNAELVAL